MMPRLHAIDDIVDAVAAIYNVHASDVRGRARTKGLTEARQCICFVARERTRLSFTEIGQALSNRDHTTIMACTASASRAMSVDPWFKAATEGMLERFAPSAAKYRLGT